MSKNKIGCISAIGVIGSLASIISLVHYYHDRPPADASREITEKAKSESPSTKESIAGERIGVTILKSQRGHEIVVLPFQDRDNPENSSVSRQAHELFVKELVSHEFTIVRQGYISVNKEKANLQTAVLTSEFALPYSKEIVAFVSGEIHNFNTKRYTEPRSQEVFNESSVEITIDYSFIRPTEQVIKDYAKGTDLEFEDIRRTTKFSAITLAIRNLTKTSQFDSIFDERP